MKAIEERPDQYEAIMANAETSEFTDRIIAAIRADSERTSLCGPTFIDAEVGE